MAKPSTAPAKLRCAIYTRKSTDEGLEQDFNSLDAQREACAAYILSQRHEGWTPVPDYYDDGGFSGGSMERPALKALLAQVPAGKVDVIVVYKVDRLTRALSDFARIVEILDGAEASFVSVTQSFNTTTSMGRLVLNVLLSFAQFEREVTGERIRDKIAASKAKGMWMGGTVPLGYDVVDRKLVVNEGEATTVRMIYGRYLALGSAPQLQVELEAKGVTSKARVSRGGRCSGGQRITRGPLYVILQNRVYLGEMVHKGKSYPGPHEPIIATELFDRVQQRIASQRAERRFQSNIDEPSLLAGLLRDGHERVMSPTFAVKGERRYRYYVSQMDGVAGDPPRAPAWLTNAFELESIVRAALAEQVRVAVEQRIASGELASADIHALRQSAEAAKATLENTDSSTRALMLEMISRIDVGQEALAIHFKLDAVHSQLSPCSITAPLPPGLVRSWKRARMVIEAAAHDDPTPDPALVKLIANAFASRASIEKHGSMGAAATAQACSPEYQAVLIRLSYLAPDIVTPITEGRQPKSLTSTALRRTKSLPLEWDEQRRVLGFG